MSGSVFSHGAGTSVGVLRRRAFLGLGTYCFREGGGVKLRLYITEELVKSNELKLVDKLLVLEEEEGVCVKEDDKMAKFDTTRLRLVQ